MPMVPIWRRFGNCGRPTATASSAARPNAAIAASAAGRDSDAEPRERVYAPGRCSLTTARTAALFVAYASALIECPPQPRALRVRPEATLRLLSPVLETIRWQPH